MAVVKRKKLIALFIVVAAMFVLPMAASASSYGFKQGDYVELNGYRFIVLDPETDYLFADFYLENRAFNQFTRGYYDPKNSYNVAYYLNNVFLNNLDDIAQFIKFESWTVGDEKKETNRTVYTRIGMVSYSEWENYAKYYVGVEGILDNPSSWFWTRTIFSGDSNSVWAVGTNGRLSTSSFTFSTSVRPSMYLKPGLYKFGEGTKNNPYILSTEPFINLSEIKDLALLKTTPNEITLSWKNPTESIFSHINIYQDGTLIETNFTNQIYTFTGLTPSKEYTLTIKAVDTVGKETEGISIVVSTDDVPLIPEVQNLKSTAKHDRVNLSWRNPQSEFFHHVRIYRKLEQEDKTSSNIKSLFTPMTAYAAENDDFTPMFETNGTYWNDLTVTPETTYSYKLTTVNIAEAESEGTVITVTTAEEPAPVLEGGSFEEQENGDYLFKWTNPVTGQVKVLIDGQEYKTVDASLKQVLIPAAEMKYDLLGNPKVSLVPISESGKEGKPKKPGNSSIAGTELPFGPTELLKSSFGLLGVLGPFVLLVLAIYLVPKIKNVIVAAVQKQRNERRM